MLRGSIANISSYHIFTDKRIPKKFFSKGGEIIEIIKREKIDFKKELKLFLPLSHHPTLKNFEVVLKNEIERYL